MEDNVGLSTPWVEFYKKVDFLFKDDPEVRVEYDERMHFGVKELKLYVENEEKAFALSKLLPAEKTFGNMKMKITVLPANHEDSLPELFEKAFRGNPALSYIQNVELFETPVSYIVFKNRVVQYFADNLGDANGNRSTLYQDIANDVFESRNGIFFCTDVPGTNGIGSLGKPRGDWP